MTRRQAIAFEIGSTGNGRNPIYNGTRQPSCGGTSRMTRVKSGICERLGVKFPGSTRPTRTVSSLANGGYISKQDFSKCSCSHSSHRRP